MKVLKHGKSGQAVNNEPLHLTCPACDTEIECTRGEMTLQNDSRDGDYYEIKCPDCDRMITKAA